MNTTSHPFLSSDKDVAALLPQVIGPFDRYCSSSGMESLNAYVTTPLIATGVAPLDCSHGGSDLLDRIIAFDRAESEYANLTQTNMVTVSSFNGPRGLVAGYDFLTQPLQRHPLVDEEKHPHVYDAEPLFAVTRSLYGTVEEKHFPILPGQHLLCAYKTLHHQGPCVLYGCLGLAIAEDRAHQADLFMEDHGTLSVTSSHRASAESQALVVENMIQAVRRIEANLGVRYAKLLIGFRSCSVQAGEVGCVITAAPYIHLARRALPQGDVQALQDMTLKEWQRAVCDDYLQHHPRAEYSLGGRWMGQSHVQQSYAQQRSSYVPRSSHH